MKKIIITVIVALTAITSFAQTNADSSAHLTFKGVPIDGTLSSFVHKLEQQGLQFVSLQDNGAAVLKGNFAGYSNCLIFAYAKDGKNVSRAMVDFNDCDTWSLLSNMYFNLKSMLTNKYGTPALCIEEFQDVVPPTDDNSKMYSVKFDRCEYITDYSTYQGDIELKIQHMGVSHCYVTIKYVDRINDDKGAAKAMDDL